jgi:riboflavin kinase/FMN adenylyltransferase
VPPYEIQGGRVSSSLVRAALEAGDLAVATQFLGRPYRISGRVQRGQRLGRKLGFPTATWRCIAR